MKVSKEGKKEEFSKVLAEWFFISDKWDCGQCMDDKTAEELHAMMKELRNDLMSWDHMMKFIRRYKVAVDKMSVQDVQDAINLRQVKKIQSE